MRKWFKNVTTVEELRKRYRKLLKLYHPDNENGSVEITQEINAEYDLVFSILSKEKQEDRQSYTQEENEQLKAIMNAIIGFNITIEVIGTWVWHSEEYRRYHKKEISLNDIRQKYGSQTIRNHSYQYSIS